MRYLTCSLFVEVADYTDLLLVHQDRRESSKIEALRARVGARIPENSRLVGVVPKVETEAWCLADPGALSRIALGLLGANVSLDRLAEVPAYQTFLQDLMTALKELNFR